MKACTTCGEIKSLGEFYRRSDSPDGYRNDCKDCRKILSAANYFSNRPKNLETRRRYYQKKVAENPDFQKEKYWSDVEAARALSKKYYLKHREKRVAQAVQYAKKNPAKSNATKKKYKLAKKRACPFWVLSSPKLCDMIKDVYYRAQKLTEETGIVHHVDHIVPVQGKNICGLHVPWNLQVLTASENCSKQNKLLEV